MNDMFSYLNKVCAEKRRQDHSLKTQLHFSKIYIEIFVKHIGEGEVPVFDHSIKWKRVEDKPPGEESAEDQSPGRNGPWGQ